MTASSEARAASGRRLKRALAVAFGVLGGGGLLFLLVGLLLPGRWEAEGSIRLDAPPDRVFVQIDSLALWDGWTVWGDVPSRLEGPGRGVGATRAWNDPVYGSGRFTITESQPERLLRYEVAVEDGGLEVRGRFQMERDGAGTRVTWREEGDFGWNPLLGYVARTMGRAQGEELQRSLDRLRAVVEAAR